jgi:hypothetical protein
MDEMKNIGKGLTFEKVWAAIQETDRQMKENQRFLTQLFAETKREMAERAADFDREMSAQAADFDRKMAERAADFDREMAALAAKADLDRKENEKQRKESEKQFNKQFGALSHRFGEVVEYALVPELAAKFRELNFEFEKLHRNTKITDPVHNIFTQVDAYLENSDKVMIVEIKSKPDIDDIDDHIERMEKLRLHADFRNDKRIYLGAVAGAVMNDNVRTYILKSGFYVIEPSGETVKIEVPQGKYRPHEW